MQNFNLKFFTVLTLSLIIIGCSEKKPTTEDEYLNAAKAKLDSNQYEAAVSEYKEFLKAYPKSDKTLMVYNQVAGIQMEKLKNPQEAIKTYKELAVKFPQSKEAKQSLFMVAFIYDENLKDKDNAIKAYKEFLAIYPKDTDANDKMSESATTMLEVLQSGKSIEEIIQQKIENMSSQPKTDSGKVQIMNDDGNEEKLKKEAQQKKKEEDPRVPPVKKEDPNSDKKSQ